VTVDGACIIIVKANLTLSKLIYKELTKKEQTMSRFAKNLVASETGRQFSDVQPMSTLTVKDAVVTEVPGSFAYEYRLEAHFGASTLVSNQPAHESNVFTDAIRATRRKIVEEVFGEFRPLIYQINEAIHNRDWNEASRLTGKLYHQMFEDGL
jgi:hypothetical protein